MIGERATGQGQAKDRLPVAMLAAMLVCSVACRVAPAASDGSSRIVSLAPALTSIVTALGAGERLVGVTRHCAVQTGLSPEIVGDFAPVAERVMAVRPDLVLMAAYASQAPERAKLEALGLPVKALALETLADLEAAVAVIGEMVGRPQDVARVADEIAAARRQLAACLGAAARPSWLVIYGVETAHVYSTGGGDHVAELLTLAGASNALAGHPRSARIGLEVALAKAPDIIIHVAPSAELPDDAAARAYWGRWPEIPAVKHGAVHVWPDDLLARNGPHLAHLAGRLCGLLKTAVAP